MVSAKEWNQQVLSIEAAENIDDALFVVLTSTGLVEQADATTERPIGVLREAVVAGDTAAVVYGGVAHVKAGGNITAGALVGPKADGTALALTPGAAQTAYVAGIALEAGSSGEYVAILVQPAVNVALAAA